MLGKGVVFPNSVLIRIIFNVFNLFKKKPTKL